MLKVGYKDAAGLEVVREWESHRHVIGTLGPGRLGRPLPPEFQGSEDTGAVILVVEVQHVAHLPQVSSK